MKGELLEAYVALSKAWAFLDFKRKECPEKEDAIKEIMQGINVLQGKIYRLKGDGKEDAKD